VPGKGGQSRGGGVKSRGGPGYSGRRAVILKVRAHVNGVRMGGAYRGLIYLAEVSIHAGRGKL